MRGLQCGRQSPPVQSGEMPAQMKPAWQQTDYERRHITQHQRSVSRNTTFICILDLLLCGEITNAILTTEASNVQTPNILDRSCVAAKKRSNLLGYGGYSVLS